MHRGIITAATSATLLALAAPAAAASMTDCAYTGRILGKRATMVVKGGEPVSYKWRNYYTSKVHREGNIISVDAATLTNLTVGATQSGKPAFQGDWHYRGHSENVTFICP